MKPDTSNPFDATATSLGYAFQFRYALKQALESMRTGYNWTIRIEGADDVELVGASFRELRQLKQVKRTGKLTVGSRDLWKTLRIWSTFYSTERPAPGSVKLYLVTTGKVLPDSTIGLLTNAVGSDEISLIDRELVTAGGNSTDETVQKCFKAYRNLDLDDRLDMLRNTRVLAGEEDVMQLQEAIRSDFRLGTREEHLQELIERVEGWWFQACLECLAHIRDGIAAVELDACINDIKDQLRPENLPVDVDITQAESPELESFAERNFVRQLELAIRSRRRIQIAVRDYLRASTQRSRWTRKNLLRPGELEDYERRLQEEWELVFEEFCEELDEDADELQKQAIARSMIGWAGRVHSPIRPNFTEPFVCRGSYQMLADDLQVGWHPEYMIRLMQIVEAPAEPNS